MNDDYKISFGLIWPPVNPEEQTVSFIRPSGRYRITRTFIENEDQVIRVTHGQKISPGFRLSVLYKGQPCNEAHIVRLRLVDSVTRQLSSAPRCRSCVNYADLKMVGSTNVIHGFDGIRLCMTGGVLELNNLRVDCVTINRRHPNPFAIEAEFLDDGPLHGRVVYSCPFEVVYYKISGTKRRRCHEDELESVRALSYFLRFLKLNNYVNFFVNRYFTVDSWLRLDRAALSTLGLNEGAQQEIYTKIKQVKNIPEAEPNQLPLPNEIELIDPNK